MNDLNIQIETPARTGSGYQAYIIDQGAHNIPGCTMGRGASLAAAIEDLFYRVQFDVNAKYGTSDIYKAGFRQGDVKTIDGKNINEIVQARSTMQLVDIFGDKLTAVTNHDGCTIRNADNYDVDQFTHAEYREILIAGTESDGDLFINW